MLHTAFKVADTLAQSGALVGVIDLMDISHCDTDQLQAELSRYAAIVTLEEGFQGRGGMDAMLFDFVACRGMKVALCNKGVTGGYRFELGSRTELHEQVGIGPDAVLSKIQNFMAESGL